MGIFSEQQNIFPGFQNHRLRKATLFLLTGKTSQAFSYSTGHRKSLFYFSDFTEKIKQSKKDQQLHSNSASYANNQKWEIII